MTEEKYRIEQSFFGQVPRITTRRADNEYSPDEIAAITAAVQAALSPDG
jgi:hypothetical protein